MTNKHHPKLGGGLHEALQDHSAQNQGPNWMNPALAVDSDVLLKGKKELIIEHQGRLYRLQATRQGKLILTK
jgi:hemin uptake protein HemP